MSRTRILLTTAVLVVGALTLSASSQAACIRTSIRTDKYNRNNLNNPVNNGQLNWLQREELLGGHTIDRHVGKTDEQLLIRLTSPGKDIPADGSFTNAQTAQTRITAALYRDRVQINRWANGNGDDPTLTKEYTVPNTNIGRVAIPLARSPEVVAPKVVVVSTCRFRTVIRSPGNGNCILLSAFPVPPSLRDHCPL